MKFIVSLFVKPQASFHPAFDVRGRKEHHTALIFQSIVEGNVIIHHRVTEFVSLIEDEQRTLDLDQLSSDCIQFLTDSQTISADSDLHCEFADEVRLVHILRARKDIDISVALGIETCCRCLADSG